MKSNAIEPTKSLSSQTTTILQTHVFIVELKMCNGAKLVKLIFIRLQTIYSFGMNDLGALVQMVASAGDSDFFSHAVNSKL